MEKNGKSLWKELSLLIKDKIGLESFNIWFKPLRFHSLTPKKLNIGVPNLFFSRRLKEKYLSIIQSSLKQVMGKEMEIDFLWNKKNYLLEKQTTNKPTSISRNYFSRLSPKYDFDNFVVGNSNRLSHAAALAVAQTPSVAYNPLFIYGDVGLGKTHLLQAIAHYILRNKPQLSFTYLPCEQFTNELINAIRDDKTVKFRKKYRNTDVLLVDDIQFLAGKERTQEEFFHTFNALYEAPRQIVLSSDRPPIEIPALEKRLSSRFEWGLITDIQPPDLETRIAILRKKAKFDKIELPDDVAVFIAERVKTNIRKLEGCLLRLSAHSSLYKVKMDKALAEDVLRDIIPQKELRPISIELIQKVVSRYYKIKESSLKGKKRIKSIVLPRQIAMFLSRELTDSSFPEIGERFGGKDHTTVMYAWRKIAKQKGERESLGRELLELDNILKKENE